MFAHNSQYNGETESGADAGGLGSEKGIKNPRKDGLRYSRAVVRHFHQDAPFADSFCAQPDRPALAVLLDGLPRVAHQIHQHLLKVTRIGAHEWEGRVEIDLHANFFRGEAEPLQVQGALHDLIQGHGAALRKGFPSGQEYLPQNGAGTFRFLVDLPQLLGVSGKVLAREKPVGVTHNAGQRVAQFMRDTANHLSQ